MGRGINGSLIYKLLSHGKKNVPGGSAADFPFSSLVRIVLHAFLFLNHLLTIGIELYYDWAVTNQFSPGYSITSGMALPVTTQTEVSVSKGQGRNGGRKVTKNLCYQPPLSGGKK